MSASYHIFKNGSVVAITSSAIKTNTAHGNPPSESVGTVGKFSTKVRSSGPISSK